MNEHSNDDTILQRLNSIATKWFLRSSPERLALTEAAMEIRRLRKRLTLIKLTLKQEREIENELRRIDKYHDCDDLSDSF